MNIESDFPQLKNQIYLDNAGAIPVPQPLLHAFVNDTAEQLLGNPHSLGSPSSSFAALRVAQTRATILEYFNTSSDKYSVVFTQNATNALKIIADIGSWKTDNFWYLRECHTSVVGIRESVLHARGAAGDVSLEEFGIRTVKSEFVEEYIKDSTLVAPGINSLFAYPAQCNHSGTRFPLTWIKQMQKHGWNVLVDCASYCSTTPLDLTKYPADFNVISFYKLFGYPTSLGALIVKKSTLKRFITKDRLYFGGGTVEAVAIDSPWHRLHQFDAPQHPLELGTLPFLEIMAVSHGFDYIRGLGGWNMVQEIAFSLTENLLKRMRALSHGNGVSVCVIYEHAGREKGPIINFNIKGQSGNIIGFNTVVTLASVNNIHLRGGCFCNPGACQHALELTTEDIQSHAEVYGHKCGDSQDLIKNRPVGSIRVSLGFVNTSKDIDALLAFIERHFVVQSIPLVPKTPVISGQIMAKLAEICVYPVKSCGALRVDDWPLVRKNGVNSDASLLGDRVWMLVDYDSKALNQKRCPALCTIIPKSIDLKSGKIVFTSSSASDECVLWLWSLNGGGVNVEMCGKCIQVRNSDKEASSWFSKVLGLSCKLVRVLDSPPEQIAIAEEGKMEKFNYRPFKQSFSNESPFLLISTKSFDYLGSQLPNGIRSRHEAFRANFIINDMNEIDTLRPFEEDSWEGRDILIGINKFNVTAQCRRCYMICVDQTNGSRSSEPLSTLATIRKTQITSEVPGTRITFGVHIQLASSSNNIGKKISETGGDIVGVVKIGDVLQVS
ncbi:hypothetical protein HK096_002435 [Nowakowskiella sp. JEL0078]|nr:hypothetical protein HK096_002435 [Nowakowskiella sp. JEL0078]